MSVVEALVWGAIAAVVGTYFLTPVIFPAGTSEASVIQIAQITGAASAFFMVGVMFGSAVRTALELTVVARRRRQRSAERPLSSLLF